MNGDDSRLHSRILLVDDEPGVVISLKRYLEMKGAVILEAGNGLEALEILRRDTVDIVLTDRNMPGLGGQELLQEIRRQWPNIDVLLMTGLSSVQNAVEVMRLGAADYIEKPVDLPATYSILKRVEANRKIRLERDRLKAEVALRELSQVITSNLHMSDLPDRIAQLIVSTFKAGDVTIQYRFADVDDESIFWRSPGLPTELDESEQLLVVEAQSRGEIVQQEMGPRWLACIPLLSDRRTRGYLLITRTLENGAFDAQQLDLLKVMASHVNVALENAHLYHVATREMRSTQQLTEIGRRLNSRLDMENTLDEIHAGIRSFVNCEYTAVIHLDRSVHELTIELRGRSRPDAQLQNELREHFDERVTRINDAQFHWQTRRFNGRYEYYNEVSGRVRFQSWVPLSDSYGIFGLMGVIRLAGENFSQLEVRNFMLLSSSVSSALQNSLLFTSQRRLHLETVQVLSKSIDEKDHYTHGHSAQVAAIAVKVARAMGLGEEELIELRLGGLMHDLGKIGIRDAVLNKPGKLNPDEYSHIKTHPLIGAKILERAPHLHHLIPYVRHHHERWDGAGYPDGLRGEAIPLAVRSLSIADVFHAMASDRIYRKGMEVDKILRILRNESGRMFEPRMVDKFLDLWDKGVINQDDINFDPASETAG